MSSNFIFPVTLLSAGSMTGTTTIKSLPLDLLKLTGAALQASWTGTPTGTLSVEGSIDGINYSDIGASIPTQPAGAAGSVLLNLVDLQFRYARMSYTNATGSGGLTVMGEAKQR